MKREGNKSLGPPPKVRIEELAYAEAAKKRERGQPVSVLSPFVPGHPIIQPLASRPSSLAGRGLFVFSEQLLTAGQWSYNGGGQMPSFEKKCEWHDECA